MRKINAEIPRCALDGRPRGQPDRLAFFFKLAFRQLPAGRGDEVSWIRLGAAEGRCGLLLHSLVDFNLHIPANAAWFAVCVAFATTLRLE